MSFVGGLGGGVGGGGWQGAALGWIRRLALGGYGLSLLLAALQRGRVLLRFVKDVQGRVYSRRGERGGKGGTVPPTMIICVIYMAITVLFMLKNIYSYYALNSLWEAKQFVLLTTITLYDRKTNDDDETNIKVLDIGTI